MKTFGIEPRRGEMNNRGIYVLSDYNSKDIGFYDLSDFGASPIIRSQSGYGGSGLCGFMDEDNVLDQQGIFTNIIYPIIINNR